MAQKTAVTVTYFSDLSGKEIGTDVNPTFSFGWGGDTYKIDLTNTEGDKFLKLLQPYLDAATKVPNKSRTKATKRSATPAGPVAADIRGWARENGYKVPDRGRIPSDVREAYDAAN